MKKIYLLAVLIGTLQNLTAQHNLSLGFGFPATQTLRNNLLRLKGSVIGPFNLSYQYETGSLSLGTGITYVNTETYTENSSIGFTYLSLLGKANYLFIAREKLKLYSGISIGAAYRYNEFCADVFPALHLQLFGVRYQFAKLGAVAELGYGVNGILNVGVNYEF
jgi:hypothetical protein